MRHLLHDPHFPDIVGEWADATFTATLEACGDCANDNTIGEVSDLAEPYLAMLARMEIAATRAW